MIGSVALLLAVASPAAPVVLYDTGQTSPAAGAALPRPAHATRRPPPPRRCRSCRPATTTHSPGLLPGRPKELSVELTGIPRPLFLVGADRGSVAWLRAQRARLAKIGAVGLMVDVSAPSQLAVVRRAAGDLAISVGSGTALARRYGFRTYPVLLLPAGAATR